MNAAGATRNYDSQQAKNTPSTQEMNRVLFIDLFTSTLSLARRSSVAVFLVLVLFTACSPEPAETGSNAEPEVQLGPDHIEVVLNFEVGKSYIYEFDMSYEMDFGEELGAMLAGGQTVTQFQKFSISVTKESPESGKTLEFKFLQNRIEMDLGAMKMTYDSEEPIDPNDPGSAMFAPFNKVIGATIVLEIDQDQKVTSVTGIDELRESILETANPQIAGMASGIFSNYYVENLTVPSGNPLRPIKPGDSWPSSATHNLGALGTFMADLQYQFKKMEIHEGSECAQIAFSGTIKGKPSDIESNEFGQMMEITGGTIFGRQWYDPKTGQITDSSSEQKMKIKMSVPGIPAEALQEGGLILDVQQQLSRKLVRVESISSDSNALETETAEQVTD